MTPQALPLKKDPVSTSFMSSEEDFFTDLTLGTYLEAISHHESLIPPLDEHEADSAKRRSRMLDQAVKKLALMAFEGKE
jgi:hypothetical protein